MAILAFAVCTGAVLCLYLFWRIAFGRNYEFPAQAITYHHIEGRLNPLATKTSRAAFERQIYALKEHGFRSLTPDEFLAQQHGAGERSVLITFDDCYSSVAEHALPVLASAGYTAMLFPITGYMGAANTWDVRLSHAMHMTVDEIKKAIARGFSIGSHTRTHRDLTRLSRADLTDELQGSRKYLEDTFGMPIKYLAYPFGRYNDRVKEAVRECGYEAAFTINRPMFQRERDPYAIPASGVYVMDTLGNFLSKVERDSYVWIDDIKCKLINRFADGALLVKGNRTA
jgi:peptidoglycan/xylan/chitin deacetylase (PgdA/CDA1 family)